MSAARTLARRLRDALPPEVTALPPTHESSAWLRSRIADVLQGALSGRLRVDRHLATPEHVGLCALWAPAIDCVPCAAAVFGAVEGTEEERRCDRCGEVRDTISSHCVVVSEVLVVVFGLCPRCHRLETAGGGLL